MTVRDQGGERARALLEALPVLWWVVDAQGAVMDASPRWREHEVHEVDAAALEAAWASARRSAEPFELACRLRAGQGGRVAWHLVRARPLGAGAWLATATDVDGLMDGSDRLIAVVTHDLRNPLGAVLMGVNHALRIVGDERVASTLRRMHASSLRMSRLIDQLADFSALRGGRGLHLQLAPANVGELARRAAADQAAREGRVRVEVAGGDVDAVCDADRMARVFASVIANLLFHTPAEKDVGVLVDGGDATVVIVTLVSPGLIAGQALSHLFEPYRSGELTREQRASGVGIGLHVAREIVRAHGGAITVRSAPGEGTTYEVRVPRVASAEKG
jgi:signal transduction histidine kinase